MTTVLKTLALTVGVLFALGVVLTTTTLFFGSSKVGTLFAGSANALEGDTVVPRPRRDADLADAGPLDGGSQAR